MSCTTGDRRSCSSKLAHGSDTRYKPSCCTYSGNTLPVSGRTMDKLGDRINKSDQRITDSVEKISGLEDKIRDLETLLEAFNRRLSAIECSPPPGGGAEFQSAYEEEFGKPYGSTPEPDSLVSTTSQSTIEPATPKGRTMKLKVMDDDGTIKEMDVECITTEELGKLDIC